MTTPLNPASTTDLDIALTLLGSSLVQEATLPVGAVGMPAEAIGTVGPWYAIQLASGQKVGWCKSRAEIAKQLDQRVFRAPDLITGMMIDKLRGA